MTTAPLRVTAIVPARMASTRYPGKPLALIHGLPMVEHVRRRAQLSKAVRDVVVATCDDEIRRAVESYGGAAVMTAATHERCTDRVAEAARGLQADIVVMVQGDEPLLDPRDLELVVAPLLADPQIPVTNLLSPLQGPQDVASPDVVKAAVAPDGRVLFLTRASIPFRRSTGPAPVHRQTGIMALRRSALEQFAYSPPTPLEQIEAIDMLRLIEHGVRLQGVLTTHATQGVDRPGDVALVEAALVKDAHQQDLLVRTLQPGAIAREAA